MASKRKGKQTVYIKNPLSIISTASIVGPKEGKGPLSSYFDVVMDDDKWGEKSWEKAESKMLKETLGKIVNKSGKPMSSVNYLISGDLLNQCTASSFAFRDTEIPFFGVYGACSTMAESLSLGAMLVDGGFADDVVCITSSHFCSAEKQFRFPLELGSQRTPTSQWTVTGAGGAMLSNTGIGPYISCITTGKVVDMGVKDTNNMGAAMAPAAADTIITHFKDTGLTKDDYDLIVTGDLGSVGKDLCNHLTKIQGFDIEDKYNDCGVMIFDMQNQDAHAGASGCGCSAVTLAGYLYHEMKKGKYNNILFVATGALMSPTSTQQGESISGIAHAIRIQNNIS